LSASFALSATLVGRFERRFLQRCDFFGVVCVVGVRVLSLFFPPVHTDRMFACVL
jgi:hypothetical protein